MKFILKLLLAPLMLVLWIVEWALTLALKASAVVCVIASALFLLSGVFYFVDGNVQNGCICLGIAFLLSPYGLHYILFAVLWGISGWFQSMGAASCVVDKS